MNPIFDGVPAQPSTTLHVWRVVSEALIMSLRSRILLVSCSAACLSGCASLFDQPLNYASDPKDAVGTITVSDPKLYTREMLINERSQEVNWISQLLKDSEDGTKVKFTPDLVRETEQISAFAASLGLKFDPTAALNYQRSKETGDIQQQIDVLKLQLQLEQLKRDAELMRANLPNQTVPGNQDLGKLGTGTVGQASSSVTAPSPADMKTLVDGLLTALTSHLDNKDTVLAKESGLGVNPIDDFRDRTAYRDMLKSARNAAALDGAHDANASSLFRLNFQAMVVPDPDLPRSLGAVQLRVMPPKSLLDGQKTFLDKWLQYQNFDRDERNDKAKFKQGGAVSSLLESRFFDKQVEFGIDVLTPRLQNERGEDFPVTDLTERAKWTDTKSDAPNKWEENSTSEKVARILSTPEKLPSLREALCERRPPPAIPGAKTSPDWVKVDRYTQVSADRIQAYDYLVKAHDVAIHFGKNPEPIETEIENRVASARQHFQSLHDVLGSSEGCQLYISKRSAPYVWRVVAKGGLGLDAKDVHIYDIGPREQVERVSTVARAANSLSLAASLVASNPGSGAAAEAATGYSQQATDRASVSERVPTAVGYAVAGEQTFGWVLGPRASVDAKGKVKVEQLLKPFDLSVDFSVPSWWNELTLQIDRIWAPTPKDLVNGALKVKSGSAEGTSRNGNEKKPATPTATKLYNIVIQLPHRESDFRSLTDLLVSKGKRPVTISSVKGVVNACSKVWLIVRGQNLWRAQNVYVLGQKIEQGQFSILADMGGIDVAVPAMSIKQELVLDPRVEIVTPLGSASHEIAYRGEPSGDACKPAKSKETDDPDATSISDVQPVDFFVSSKFQITATGKNLKKITTVTLYDVKGALNVLDNGDKLTADFDTTLAGIPPGENIPLNFLDKDGKAVVKPTYVRIRRTKGD